MTTCREIFTFSWPLRGRGRGGQPKRSAWPLFSRFFFVDFPNDKHKIPFFQISIFPFTIQHFFFQTAVAENSPNLSECPIDWGKDKWILSNMYLCLKSSPIKKSQFQRQDAQQRNSVRIKVCQHWDHFLPPSNSGRLEASKMCWEEKMFTSDSKLPPWGVDFYSYVAV